MRLTNRQYDALRFQLESKRSAIKKEFTDALRAKINAAAAEFTQQVIDALPQSVLSTKVFKHFTGYYNRDTQQIVTAKEYWEDENIKYIINPEEFPINGKFFHKIIGEFDASLPKVQDIMFKVDFAETGVDITRLVDENYNVDIEAAVKAALE